MKKLLNAVLLAVTFTLIGCGGGGSDAPAPAGPTVYPGPATLQVVETLVGTGATATAGNEITVNYTGWLYDPTAPQQKGRQFDTSVGKTPFTFVLGNGRVIAGWDQGLPGMKVGGKRTLQIPSGLGYGSAGAGGVIPPNSGLVFDVELISIK